MKLEEAAIEEKMRQYDLPIYMISGMVNYLVHHVEPGSFMRSLLENDLYESARRADPQNRMILPMWAEFLRMEVPRQACGSKEVVRLWLENKPKKEDTE